MSKNDANGPAARALRIGLNGIRADVLDRAKPEADDTVPYRGELLRALVDVGRKDGDAELAALADVLGDLVRLSLDARQEPGHEVRRVSAP